jgi:TolB-like protein/Tfp pilus assembly protein PilF
MSEGANAVFLSHASEDGEVARSICDALRMAGIEVWFDQNELRGGDAWDQSIRRQIKACSLFIAVISKNTHARAKGYFRLEWKLAVDRSHLMLANKAFLVPVVVDETGDDDENVPDRFREVQWTRLTHGNTSAQFVERISELLKSQTALLPALQRPDALPAAGTGTPGRATWVSRRLTWTTGAVALAAVGAYLLVTKPSIPNQSAASQQHASVAQATPVPERRAAAVFDPPPHSIAVLPFVNMSGDKNQEYFSDGLTEEVLNSLARIDELRVAARTSSFSFKGENADIATIARRLNVAAVLEGSVRRSEHTVRVTTQLIDARTGFDLWSQSYDRSLGDVLKMQGQIAAAVANALKVTLLADIAARLELGGTRNPGAFDAYLHGLALDRRFTASDIQTQISDYTRALSLDPHYALAFAGRSIARNNWAGEFASVREAPEAYAQSRADAERAVALAPDLADGHLALALVAAFESLDFRKGLEEHERAFHLAPGNVRVLIYYARFVAWMGRIPAALAAAQRALELDPLNPDTRRAQARVLFVARRYRDAISAYDQAIAMDAARPINYAERGLAYLALGDLESANRSCEVVPDYADAMDCLAITYAKLGRRAQADAILAKAQSITGDAAAYQYAQVYAQRGDRDRALHWLERAMQVRDGGVINVKTDPMMDPLRNEPRFAAIENALRFPD